MRWAIYSNIIAAKPRYNESLRDRSFSKIFRNYWYYRSDMVVPGSLRPKNSNDIARFLYVHYYIEVLLYFKGARSCSLRKLVLIYALCDPSRYRLQCSIYIGLESYTTGSFWSGQVWLHKLVTIESSTICHPPSRWHVYWRLASKTSWSSESKRIWAIGAPHALANSCS